MQSLKNEGERLRGGIGVEFTPPASHVRNTPHSNLHVWPIPQPKVKAHVHDASDGRTLHVPSTSMEIDPVLPLLEGDLDLEVGESHDDHPRMKLRPREEWPPAVRPAIKGKRKILQDNPFPPAAEKRAAPAKKNKVVNPESKPSILLYKEDLDSANSQIL